MARKRKLKPLVLYSTSTLLAYKVSERYYRHVHWVWCASQAGPAWHDTIVPPSSSPLKIYQRLREDVKGGDRHSAAIAQNRAGVLRGANARRQQGVIGEREEAEIRAAVQASQTSDFRPLLFIIPFAGVRRRIREVPVEECAHPLWPEYIIESLRRASFDIIEFP